jgi:cardiolipin synthase
MTPPAASNPPLLGEFSFFDVWVAGVVLSLALAASAHAVIYKRESRAATLWVFVIWILPAAGTLLYLLLGINRVRRRARALRRMFVRHRRTAAHPAAAGELAACGAAHLAPLVRLVDALAPRPLVAGNAVEPLLDGRAAFPAMLAAIDGARSSVGIASYIFDGDGIGADFVSALGRACARGVAVRVLIDDVDARFSRSVAVGPLRRAGVTVGVFNPPFVPARLNAVHLRNHRKILVVDGTVGFTGGLNVDRRYWLPEKPDAAFRDLHFRLRGPVVSHLAEIFADDWKFTVGESLHGPAWFPSPAPAGGLIARGIEAGPDESVERLRWTLLGAVNAAQSSIRICTPYFIPDNALLSALSAAALRGVTVDIYLPQKNDLPHVAWAAMGQMWQVMEQGCRVWLSPGPFDHTKLLVVDGAWVLFGSVNWDARSLRLNFEANVEVYGCELAGTLESLLHDRHRHAHRLTPAQLKARLPHIKLRDGIARLFAPFL